MDPAVVAALRCPIDSEPLSQVDRSICCAVGHSFDVARQGYVNFTLPGPKRARLRSDSIAMVTARERFLATGAFDPIIDAVASQVAPAGVNLDDELIAELGSGTAAYLRAALDTAPGSHGLAIDLSVPATIRAARSHARTTAIVADSWQPLPLADRSVQTVIVAFAPRNLPEVRRVLRPGGRLILAAALPGHLAELREEFNLLAVAERNTDRLVSGAADARFAVMSQDVLNYPMTLDQDAVKDVILMGPNAWHVDQEDLVSRINAAPNARNVSVAVSIATFEVPSD